MLIIAGGVVGLYLLMLIWSWTVLGDLMRRRYIMLEALKMTGISIFIMAFGFAILFAFYLYVYIPLIQ